MNRRSQNQNSTDRILKSKYLERQKSKFTQNALVGSKKVMLTDLCAQQKLKVGELIKINEFRKTENQQLAEELNQIRLKFVQCQSKLSQLEKEFEEKQEQCHNLTQQIERLEVKTMENEIVEDKMKMEIKQYKDIAQKIMRVSRVNCSVQTEVVKLVEISVQTKKAKMKNRDVQVEIEIQVREDANRNSFKGQYYRNQSKSSEREVTDVKGNQSIKNSYSRSNNQINDSEKYLKSNRNEQDQYDHSHEMSKQEEMEECFDELAKKWLTLKEKNISKLKAQYQHSKAKIMKEDYDKINQPKQFNDDIIDTMQRQTEEDIDEMELNRMLKSKNFSASRLLNTKGVLGDSANTKKSSFANSAQQHAKLQPKKMTLNIKNHNYENKKMGLNVKKSESEKMTLQQIQGSTRQNNNAHLNQIDFLDLIQSLNQ